MNDNPELALKLSRVKGKRTRKTPTTITVAQDQLDDLTTIAEERGMSRAAVMISSFANTIADWKKSKM